MHVSKFLFSAQSELEAAKQELTERIRSYPRPVERDDAHFNQLLAERRKVMIALGALASETHFPVPRSLEIFDQAIAAQA